MLGRSSGVSFPQQNKEIKFLSIHARKTEFEVQPPPSPNPVDFLSLKTSTFLVYSAPTENVGTLHRNIFDVCQTTVNRPGRLKGCDSP